MWLRDWRMRHERGTCSCNPIHNSDGDGHGYLDFDMSEYPETLADMISYHERTVDALIAGFVDAIELLDDDELTAYANRLVEQHKRGE